MKRSSSPLVSSVPATATNGSSRPLDAAPDLAVGRGDRGGDGHARQLVRAAASIRAAATPAHQRVGSAGFDR